MEYFKISEVIKLVDRETILTKELPLFTIHLNMRDNSLFIIIIWNDGKLQNKELVYIKDLKNINKIIKNIVNNY